MTDPLRRAFFDELRERAVGSVRIASVLSIGAFASFALVDPLLVESVRPLWILRGVGILVLALLGASTFLGERFVRHSGVAGVATCLVTSVLVILLTRMTGGGTSGYHEALIITFFGFALLPLPWTSALAGSLFASMVALYDIIMVVADVTGPTGTWLSKNAVLWTSAVVAAVLMHFSQQLRWEDFQNRAQLASARDRLEALDRAKSAFFANISHELRTPLTLALAPVQALLEERVELTEAQIQHLELVERNALRLLRLVDDLLELSRADAAALKLRVEPLDLHALTGELVAEAAPLARRKDLTLTLAAGPAPPPIHTDPTHVERVLLDVLANAVKFTPRGGSIVVSVVPTEQGAQVRIADTGIGIPADQLEHIFDRFHQVDVSATRSHSGAGIGLALARELIELCGGRITATSAVGEGTAVTVDLPRGEEVISADTTLDDAEADHGLPEWHAALQRQDGYRLRHLEDATERRLVPRARGTAAAHTILVVEDNRDMVRFLAALLAAEGRVLTATDGLTGLRLAEEHRPDLIVSDVMMPGLDGLELVERIRATEATRTTPIILITARGTEEDRVEGRAVGADAFLAKPFRAAELRAAVRSLLSRRGASRAQAREVRVESMRYLAGGITEELRAPLDAIDESLTGLDPDASSPDLVGIRAELGRLRSALLNLERFALRTSGPPMAQSLEAVVLRALQATRDEAEGRRLIRELGPCAEVAAGPGELEQIVGHLLSNAFLATRPGGNVTVTLGQKKDRVVLSVTDQGPGIPIEHAERIFAPYYTTRESARGMGLALSRRLAERNGGTLELVTNGPGARFVLELPAARQV